MSTPSIPNPLDQARNNDATVNRMLRGGYPLEHIILQLVTEKEHLMQKMLKLELIAPRKIVVDGKVLIYRAPAHLIPDISE